MEIGKPIETITVTPAEVDVPTEIPDPVETPVETPELVPAGPSES